MRFRRRIAALLLLLSASSLYADIADDLRNKLKHADNEERISIYGKLYDLSLETDDVDYQLRCVNDMIAEAHRQGVKKEEGDARVQKMIFFYNNDFNDSIYQQVPPLLEFLRNLEDWKNYYETWSVLIDSYNFAGQTNTSLKEAKGMYDDAKEHDSNFGMGLAYYAMGNIYANMYNNEEAANSYQKGIDLLMKIKPTPMQLSDLFAYYVDVLDLQNNFQQIDNICNLWSQFLTEHYADKDKDGEAANRWAYYYQARAQAALGLDKLEMAALMLDEMKKRCYNDEGLLGMMWTYYRAELCRKQGFYEEALALNDKRMRMLSGSDDKAMQIRVRKQRAQIYEGLGRYRDAARMYNELYVINDSINVYDTKRQLTEMNTIFHVDELKMQQAEERARQRLISIIIIALIVVIGLSIFIYFRLRSAKRLKIAHEKLEVAHQDLKTAYDQLEETTAQKERMASELRIARDIQMSMVPSVFPEREGLDMFASMTPAKEVGGDLYGYLEMDDMLYFCLGDVSGKGVPASLFMAQATRLFRTLAAQQMQPAEICTRMNNALSGEDNESGMFVTMFLGVLNLTNGHLSFCNAGHNQPVLGNEFLDMIPNAPIGLFPELDYEGEEVESIKGRSLFIYTDGLNEAENQEKKQFGDDHLLDILRSTHFDTAKQTVEGLAAEVEKHRNGAEPNDDLTMMCIRID